MRQPNLFSVLVFFIIMGIGIGLAFLFYGLITDYDTALTVSIFTGIFCFLLALFIANSIKIASHWERALVLRLGKYRGLRGPGLFFIIPFIDSIPYWIDLRVITTPFNAEKTLTKDTVPVDVDAVLFWKVLEPEKAALEVEDYQIAISWASQTALRDVIGKSELAAMLEGRDKLDVELAKIIEDRASPWGIHVISVEIRDVLIPSGLQDAMSMQAQAERERQARVILGDSERQIAQSFEDASKFYATNPTALHLRAMNMLFEGLKDKGSLIIVPSSAVDTMNLGAISGLVSLGQNQLKPKKNNEKDADKQSENDKPDASAF